MNIITPDRLTAGKEVAIVSSARKITVEEIQPAKKLFESWGLQVHVGQTIGASYHQFAGSDDIRSRDLQFFLRNTDIKAIFFARGGYGSVRILDNIDWKLLKDNPKWLIGYSDVTALLMHSFFNAHTETIHGIMPLNIKDMSSNPAVDSLKNILFKSNNQITCGSHELNRMGNTNGIIIGGNLSVIYSLLGSNSFKDTDDMILVLEDLDEYLYHIDRMMQALKRAGKLKNLRALLVGQMTCMHDNAIPFGQTAYSIIADTVKEYDFPVAYDLPIGHTEYNNHAFIHGRYSSVEITDSSVIVRQ